ncbi:hypothetical protein ACIQTN_02040 [Streptomyces werraensis]|uniref:hypothetical protein n=1 Tax=Streptomyces werraensis TaxID=68284 RepID=UPI003811BAA8
MREEGYVHSVEVVTAGSYLDGAHTAGTTTLKVMDAADFNEEGGSFIMDGVTLDYVSADLEADTITLASPLSVDVEESTALDISPLTYEKQALVVVDDYDEAITAVIPHTLYDRLAEGMREEGERESVSIELRGNIWYVEDVFGIEPVIDGQYLENVVADDVLDGIITEVKLANDAVTAAKVAVGAIKPIALSETLNDTIMQRWTDSMDDPSAWTIVSQNPGATFEFVNEAEAPSGGKVGQASGYVTIKGTSPILYDPDSLYRVTARVRCKNQSASGVTSFYVGLMGLAGDKVTMVNRTGANSVSSHFYVAASGMSIPASAGWVTPVGYVKGRSASPSGSTAPNMQSPTTVHDNVRYVVPYIWLNYNVQATDSVLQVDSVTIEVLRTGVVTANELAANSVIAGKIATNAVQAGNVAAGAIQTDHLAANAVTTAKLDALAVTADKIAANSITASKIVAGAIDGQTIKSPDYVAGVSGWKIASDGSAEFNNVTLRNGQVLSGKELFYGGTPGLGNLIFSVAASTGTDPFGNAHKAGMTSYAESGNININGTNATWEHSSGSKIELSIGGGQALQRFTPANFGVAWQDATIGTHRTTDHGTNTPGLFMQGPSTTTNTAKPQIELLGGSPTQNKSLIRMTGQTRVVGDFETTGHTALGNMRMGQVIITFSASGVPASATVTYATLPGSSYRAFVTPVSQGPGTFVTGTSVASITGSSMAVWCNKVTSTGTGVPTQNTVYWQIWSE